MAANAYLLTRTLEGGQLEKAQTSSVSDCARQEYVYVYMSGDTK